MIRLTKKIENTSDKQNQRGNPNWKKGKSGNPKGKPKGSKNYTTLLEEAVKRIEDKKGRNLFDHMIERAFISDRVLIAVAKKFIPDKSSAEIDQRTDGTLIVKFKENND